jgi:hypothetical protein
VSHRANGAECRSRGEEEKSKSYGFVLFHSFDVVQLEVKVFLFGKFVVGYLPQKLPHQKGMIKKLSSPMMGVLCV